MTEKNTGAASRELGVMEGKGFYNRHSRPQRGAVAFGLPLLEHAVEAVPLPGPGEVFQVADYGVAGGTTPWSRCEQSSTGSDAGPQTTSPSPSSIPTCRRTISIRSSRYWHPRTATCRERPTSSLTRGQVLLRAALPSSVT